MVGFGAIDKQFRKPKIVLECIGCGGTNNVTTATIGGETVPLCSMCLDFAMLSVKATGALLPEIPVVPYTVHPETIATIGGGDYLLGRERVMRVIDGLLFKTK